MTEITRSTTTYGLRLAVKGVTVIFAAWFCLGMLWYMPNNGGSGLALPLNALCWITISICMIWLVFTLPREDLLSQLKMPVSSLLLMLPLGALLWSLPVIWACSSEARLESLPHVAALWGFLCLFWWLRRLPRELTLSPWLNALWIAALLQGVFAFLQVTILDRYSDYLSHRPMGIFQQPNVLASFLSTGLACLFVSEFHTLDRNGKLAEWRALRTFSLIFIPFILVLVQSRVGELSAVLAVTIISLLHYRAKSANVARLKTMWLLMLSGILLALAWQNGVIEWLLSAAGSNKELLALPPQFSIVDKSGSNSSRIWIIEQTWQMIMHHPWMGTGYGSFESAFAQQVANNGGFTGEETLIHPHNEVLYAWAEGGIPALLGLLMMVAGILAMLWRKNGLGWTGLVLLLPIALHMNLEYPLYQSVPHGLMLTMLLSLVLSKPTKSSPQKRHPLRFMLLNNISAIRFMTLVTCLITMFFMIGSLETQRVLTVVEHQEMYPLALNENSVMDSLWNPQSQATRLDYDRNVAKLIRFNFTHDNRLLEQFERWAIAYQHLHNDPNVMASRLTIARMITPEKSLSLCDEARRQWPKDVRFQCYPTVWSRAK